MGKKSGSQGQGQGGGDEGKAKAFVLKVATHCHCVGCTDKIRAAVKDLTRLDGIQSWDQSALEAKGELRLLATADPEKLRHRLHKATRKNVDLLFPNPKADKQEATTKAAKDAAALQAAMLLNTLQQQQGQYAGQGSAAWANQLLAGGGYGAAAAAAQGQYPWAAQQQPDPYSAGAWAGYASYPPAPHQGYYGGAWHGHGYY